jgi:hypothetical protein
MFGVLARDLAALAQPIGLERDDEPIQTEAPLLGEPAELDRHGRREVS